MVWGWFKCIIFIVHFISVIITSAPPQIIRHQIPEVGDPCKRVTWFTLHTVWPVIVLLSTRSPDTSASLPWGPPPYGSPWVLAASPHSSTTPGQIAFTVASLYSFVGAAWQGHANGLKIKGCAPSETCREESCLVPSGFWWLPAVRGVAGLVAASLCSLPSVARGRLLPVCLCLFSSYKNVHPVRWRANPIPVWPQLN